MAEAKPNTLSWLLDRVIRSAEGHELASPSVEFGPVILTVVASAALRELHSGTRGMPKKVIWAAMSCRPHESSSWQATLFDEGTGTDIDPMPFSIPEHITKALGDGLVGDFSNSSGNSGTMLGQLQVSQGNPAIPALPPAASLYLRRAVMELPEPHGTIQVAWLLGVNEPLIETEEGRADTTLMQSERIISDRLIHGLGTYKPVTTVLAAIDDGFRQSLQSARAAIGLVQFLDDLEADKDGSKDTTISSVPETRFEEVSDSRSISAFDSDLLKRCIRSSLEGVYGALDRDAQIKVANSGHLKTVHGEWHAFVEFSHGFGRLRSKTVLVEVCSTRANFEEALAKYLSLGVSYRETIRLLLVLSGSETELAEGHIKTWRNVTGVHFAILR